MFYSDTWTKVVIYRRLTPGLGSPGDRTGAIVRTATTEGRESFRAAHVPGGLGDLEFLGVLVGVLVVQLTVRFLILGHPFLLSFLLHILFLEDLNNI